MRGRQLGAVLFVLVAIGVGGLVLRALSASPHELKLSGLLPIAGEVVDGVTLQSGGLETRLRKAGDTWVVGTRPVYQARMAQLWGAASRFEGAQLVARNPAHHTRMGVDADSGILVKFWLGDALQEQFIVSGRWSSETALCYLRRPNRDEVYAVPCPVGNIFTPNADAWRDPVIAAISWDQVDTVSFSYPGEEFAIRPVGSVWGVESNGVLEPANPDQLQALAQALSALVASGFAADDVARQLDFSNADAVVSVATRLEARVPGTSLRFLKGPEGSYYVKRPLDDTVFTLDAAQAEAVLQPLNAYAYRPQTP